MGSKFSISRIIPVAISLFLSFLLFYAAWGIFLEYHRVESYGGNAIGLVTHKHFARGSDGNTIYYLDYEFSTNNGKKMHSTGTVLKPHWDVAKVGGALKIRYDLSNPDHNLPTADGGTSLFNAFFVSLLGVVFLVFGVMRLISSFKKTPDKSDKR